MNEYNFKMQDLHPLHRKQVALIEEEALTELCAFLKGFDYQTASITIIKSPMPFHDKTWSFLISYKIQMEDDTVRNLLGFRSAPVDLPEDLESTKR